MARFNWRKVYKYNFNKDIIKWNNTTTICHKCNALVDKNDMFDYNENCLISICKNCYNFLPDKEFIIEEDKTTINDLINNKNAYPIEKEYWIVMDYKNGKIIDNKNNYNFGSVRVLSMKIKRELMLQNSVILIVED